LIVVVAVCVGIVGGLLAIYARYLQPTRPGVTTPKGFYGFFDQGNYLAMARNFAHGRIPSRPTEYEYGIGYPILAAPFIRLGYSGDPFAPVDVLCFSATLVLTFLLGLHLGDRRSLRRALLLGLLAAGVVALASPLLEVNATPWNSNVVTPLGLLVLVIATADHPITVPRAVALGAAVGWIFATRYADALFLGAPVIALLVVRSSSERKRIVVCGGLALAAFVGPVLALQQYALGSWMNTPYQFHLRAVTGGSDQSLAQYRVSWIPSHFFGAFLTGRLNGQRVPRDPLLRQFPLLVLTPIGAALACIRRSRVRLAWIVAIAGSVVGSMFYLSFIAGGPADLKFGNARYWAPWYPLWALLAVFAIAELASRIFSASRDERAHVPASEKPAADAKLDEVGPTADPAVVAPIARAATSASPAMGW